MSSNSSTHSGFESCGAKFVLLFFFLCYLFFLLPLFLSVLFLGFQRWRKYRSGLSSVPTSHTDAFTFHLVALELLGMLAVGLYLCGAFGERANVVAMALSFCQVLFPGPPLFYVLICAERYLAVIHPLAYCGLRGRRGTLLRNGSAGGAWLLCALWGCLLVPWSPVLGLLLNFILVVMALLTVLFCCIMVLCALIRPTPGDRGRIRPGVDQLKRRAFNTIVVTLGALLLRLTVNLLSHALLLSGLPSFVFCLVSTLGVGFHLPITVVSPILFLQRAGKLLHQRQATSPH